MPRPRPSPARPGAAAPERANLYDEITTRIIGELEAGKLPWVADLSHRLARDAEGVCRHYLPAGRREGRYWLVGDIENSPGRSLFVRLNGPESGKGAAGKWTDAATGEHGDLLDLIRLNRRLDRLPDLLEEARSFLRLPRPEPTTWERQAPAPRSSPEAARRLWAAGKPIGGTLAERYLRSRAITAPLGAPPLRFHPRCFTRTDDEAEPQSWPALLAAVTDLDGAITGLHRTWLDHATGGKAPLSTPRRAMGDLLGNGVRFGPGAGRDAEVLAAGEGLETVLALRSVLPRLPAVAALSANHLAALELPATLRRLYVVQDDDPAARARHGDNLGRRRAHLGGLANRGGARPRREDVAPHGGDAVRNPDLRRSRHERARLRTAQGRARPAAVDHRRDIHPAIVRTATAPLLLGQRVEGARRRARSPARARVDRPSAPTCPARSSHR